MIIYGEILFFAGIRNLIFYKYYTANACKSLKYFRDNKG